MSDLIKSHQTWFHWCHT